LGEGEKGKRTGGRFSLPAGGNAYIILENSTTTRKKEWSSASLEGAKESPRKERLLLL